MVAAKQDPVHKMMPEEKTRTEDDTVQNMIKETVKSLEGVNELHILHELSKGPDSPHHSARKQRCRPPAPELHNDKILCEKTTQHSMFSSSEEEIRPEVMANYVDKTDYLFLLDKVSELSKIIGQLGRRVNALEDCQGFNSPRKSVHSSCSDFNALNNLSNKDINKSIQKQKKNRWKVGSSKVSPVAKNKAIKKAKLSPGSVSSSKITRPSNLKSKLRMARSKFKVMKLERKRQLLLLKNQDQVCTIYEKKGDTNK